MKGLLMGALSWPSLTAGQIAMFDIDSDQFEVDLVTQDGWASARALFNDGDTNPIVAISNDVTLTLSLVNAEDRWNSRDRQTFNTPQGVDNDDDTVPEGTFSALYRDFLFVEGDEVNVTLEGLSGGITYLVDFFSYESGQLTIQEIDWLVNDEVLGVSSFSGDQGLGTGLDPNTNQLTDYRTTIEVEADNDGKIVILGRKKNGILAINGISVSDSMKDSDDDGLTDAVEQKIIDADPDDEIETFDDVLPQDDFDNDFSPNRNEAILGTNPVLQDTDGDGYWDGYENDDGIWVSVTRTGSNPLDDDSDNDGLKDGVENPDLDYDPENPATQPGTNPNLPDSDGDGFTDGDEIFQDDTIPTNNTSFPIADQDGLAFFDFGLEDGIEQAGWSTISISTDDATAPLTAVSNGITLSLSIPDDEWGSRDRGIADTATGVDNDDNEVPSGLYSDVYRDIIFTAASEINVELSGLLPNTAYPITFLGYDSAQDNTRSTSWSTQGGDVATAEFVGDFAANSIDPDTNRLSTYAITLVVVSDNQGVVALTGTSSLDPASMFLNGVIVDQPVERIKVSDIKRDAVSGQVTITWKSEAGEKYLVRETSDPVEAGDPEFFNSDPETWKVLAAEVDSMGDETSFIDTTSENVARRVYRIELAPETN